MKLALSPRLATELSTAHTTVLRQRARRLSLRSPAAPAAMPSDAPPAVSLSLRAPTAPAKVKGKALSLRSDLLARLPEREAEPLAAPTAASPRDVRRMAALMAATDRPALSHYERLAALPPSMVEPPVTTGQRVKAIALGVFALGLGLGTAMTGCQALAAMMQR